MYGVRVGVGKGMKKEVPPTPEMDVEVKGGRAIVVSERNGSRRGCILP